MEKETGKGSPDKKGAAVRQEDKGQRERGESPRFILILNPGSTSTKIALYQEETQIFSDCINHNPEELGAFAVVFDQLEYRLEIVNQVLKSHLVDRGCLSAVMGRGGMVYGLKTGGYLVDERLFEALKGGEHTSEHASNLGGLMAYVLARPLGIPAFIYDAVTSCEMEPVARVTGMPDIVRQGCCHVLNSRAMARKYAKEQGKRYEDLNFLVAHLGGGISVSAHREGRIIDSVGDDDGQFSPERSGSVPLLELVNLCYSGKYTKEEMKQKIRGKGGMYAYLGTADCREIERRIRAGDEKAALIFRAQAYQIAKGIGVLSAALRGRVDVILLTGGVAHSKMLTGMIKDYVEFLAPVVILPGELEMEALALGALRLLKGKEEAKRYHPEDWESGCRLL